MKRSDGIVGSNTNFLIKSKISGTLKTTEDKIPSKFVEAAGFAYLACLNKGEVFLAK